MKCPVLFLPILITAFYVLIKLLCCECNQFSKGNNFYMFMGQLVVLFQQLLPPISLNYIFTHLMWIISLGNITFIWLTCQWVSIVRIYIYYRIYTCTIYHNYVYVSIFRLFLFASKFFCVCWYMTVTNEWKYMRIPCTNKLEWRCLFLCTYPILIQK